MESEDVPQKTEEPKKNTVPQLSLDTASKDKVKEFYRLKEELKDRKTVLWPWESQYWPQMEAIISKKLSTPEELEEAINTIAGDVNVRFFSSYFNQESKKEAKEYFFSSTAIQSLALNLPKLITKENPLLILLPQIDATVTLTKEQVAGILAHAFFCTFNRIHPVTFTGEDFPSLDFSVLYTGRLIAAMECILNYFTRVHKEMPKGKLRVHRQVLTKELTPDWTHSTKKLPKITVSAAGTIEDSDAVLHADFANEYIGGGVLHGGNVQEEILFLIKPECLCTLLFCAKMEPNEAIIITGAERFSNYSGYGHSFQFAGDHIDQSPRDESGTIMREIVAYDAIVSFIGFYAQFSLKLFYRDLCKAYCAFFSTSGSGAVGSQQGGLPKLATGNWGCGAFGGDKKLKAFQQILAAAEAEREVLYCTFRDIKLADAITAFISKVNELNLTVGDLFNLYVNNIAQFGEWPDHDLFSFLLHCHSQNSSSLPAPEPSKAAADNTQQQP